MPPSTKLSIVNKMPASIGVNLRVTGHCRQGGRKYMEDFFSVAYQQTEDERDLEYAFFGIYDGHGGAEAAAFAKEHLMETIIKQRNFWSDNDEDVLRAIKDGYISTHYNMWKEQEKWPKTTSGLPSTAGTTASIAFIRRGKIYIGHVGDSGIILGYQEPGCPDWKAKPLTRDHKPENAEELSRIERCGGKVVAKSGVPRVVWNRPRIGHQGPVRRSTPIDEIPFLAVARSLGDLWSYNSQINKFIVSPLPDCSVVPIDCNIHRCLIFGTDGLYNMLSPQMAVHIVQQAERHNENAALSDNINKTWLNPSRLLVEKALERWHSTKMRADNTSVVTLMLDPPGPPKAQVLKNLKKNAYPVSGLKIIETRYDNEKDENTCANCNPNTENREEPVAHPLYNNTAGPLPSISDIRSIRNEAVPNLHSEIEPPAPSVISETPSLPCTTENTPVSTSDMLLSSYPLKERNFVPRTRESTSFDPRDTCNIVETEEKENVSQKPPAENDDNSIQINEISSSSSDILDISEDEVSESVSTSRISLRSKRKPTIFKTKPAEEKVNAESSSSEASPQPAYRSARIAERKRKLQQMNSISPLRKALCVEKKETLVKVTKTPLAERPRVPRKTPAPVTSARLSLTQKIIKSKKIMMKKKAIIKKPISKKKAQLIMDTVKVKRIAKKPVGGVIKRIAKKAISAIIKPQVVRTVKKTPSKGQTVTPRKQKSQNTVVQRVNVESQRRSKLISQETAEGNNNNNVNNNNGHNLRVSKRAKGETGKIVEATVPGKRQQKRLTVNRIGKVETERQQKIRRIRSNVNQRTKRQN